jgi:hypothetical protein
VPDEPRFPAPGEKIREPYREAEKPAPAAPAQKIVTRAEPPPSSKPERAALTRDEMKAMLAVTAAQRTPWKKSIWRSPLLLVVSVVSHLLHAALGAYAYPLDVVLFVLALAWIARPLFRRDGFS